MGLIRLTTTIMAFHKRKEQKIINENVYMCILLNNLQQAHVIKPKHRLGLSG